MANELASFTLVTNPVGLKSTMSYFYVLYISHLLYVFCFHFLAYSVDSVKFYLRCVDAHIAIFHHFIIILLLNKNIHFTVGLVRG